MATQESGVHQNVKHQILKNTERDTVLINRTLRNTSRVAKNAISNEVARIQQDATLDIDAVRDLVSGARGRAQVLRGGDLDGGIWTAGQSQALIHDIPSCRDSSNSIMKQAEEVLRRGARCLVAGP